MVTYKLEEHHILEIFRAKKIKIEDKTFLFDKERITLLKKLLKKSRYYKQ